MRMTVDEAIEQLLNVRTRLFDIDVSEALASEQFKTFEYAMCEACAAVRKLRLLLEERRATS